MRSRYTFLISCINFLIGFVYSAKGIEYGQYFMYVLYHKKQLGEGNFSSKWVHLAWKGFEIIRLHGFQLGWDE